MRARGLPSFRALGKAAGVSQGQLRHLRRGDQEHVRLIAVTRLAQCLEVSPQELLATFFPHLALGTDLGQECAYLRGQLERQAQEYTTRLQRACLQTLEPWLIAWPTAAKRAREDPSLAASQLLPLLSPLEQLLADWGVEATAGVGEVVPYCPPHHQLLEGTAQPGEPVRIRYQGYRQGDSLLLPARVSPV